MSNLLAGLSVLVAVVAVLLAFRADKTARRSLVVAERAAVATERQADAAEAAIPSPAPPVRWHAERAGKRTVFVRNVGTETAYGVRIVVPASHEGLVRADNRSGIVEAGAAIRVMVIDVAEIPNLTELALTWTGQDSPVLVPLPAA